MKVPVTIALDEQLLAQVDGRTKPHGRSRSWFISQAVGRFLAQGATADAGAMGIPDVPEFEQHIEDALCRLLQTPGRRLRWAQNAALANALKRLGLPTADPGPAPADDGEAETPTPRGRRAAQTEVA